MKKIDDRNNDNNNNDTTGLIIFSSPDIRHGKLKIEHFYINSGWSFEVILLYMCSRIIFGNVNA